MTLTPNTDGKWISLTDGSELDAAMTALKGMVPKGPTSLHAATGRPWCVRLSTRPGGRDATP